MMCTKFVGRFRMLLALFSVGMLVLSATAQAQAPRPFRISGGGVAPNGLKVDGDLITKHEAMGEATHLGRHEGKGAFVLLVDPSTGQLNGLFESYEPFEFVAANGDKLVAHYGNKKFGAATPGKYQLTFLGGTPEAPIVSAVFVAEFVVQPDLSTGRFKGAKGSWIMEARTSAFVLGSTAPCPYVWEGRGSIVMPRPR